MFIGCPSIRTWSQQSLKQTFKSVPDQKVLAKTQGAVYNSAHKLIQKESHSRLAKIKRV